jgi:transposase
MTQLTLEAREAIIARALSGAGVSVQQIAKESNVGYSTLQRWIHRTQQGLPLDGRRRNLSSRDQSQTSPLQHLLATAGLDEQAVGVYCREQGIHSFQLKEWRDKLMKQTDNKSISPKELSELKELRNEVKCLKRELYRKDKALAETSALLILKKKADLIWGDLGED